MAGDCDYDKLGGRCAAISLSVAVSILIGIAEWAVHQRVGFGWLQGEVNRTLLGIVVLYGLFGLACGLTSAILGGTRRSAAMAFALPPAALLTIAIIFGHHSLLIGTAALAAGWLCYRGLICLVARVAFLVRTGLSWTTLGLTCAAVLAISAWNALDRTGVVIALAGAGLCVVILFLPLRSRLFPGCVASWKYVLAGTLVVITSWILGSRVPIIAPDVPVDSGRPNVLLITIDTLRADHVGAYGYQQARTPYLDRLAARGVLFRETVAPSIFTGPSHASIMTGLLPNHHGVQAHKMRIGKSVTTLADMLRAEGYVTGAFVSGFTTRDIACGLPSRFGAFDDDLRDFRWLPEGSYKLVLIKAITRFFDVGRWTPYRIGAETTDLAVRWLKRNGHRPYLLWVHLFDPHLPYQPPDAFLTAADRASGRPMTMNWYGLKATERAHILEQPGAMEHMIALYDAEIAYADAQLGRLLETAQESCPDRRLLIVVASDHGESMGEHNLFWARDLYDPTLLVPLIVVPADNEPQLPLEVTEQVRLIDVTPTILDLLAIEPPASLDGRSLVKLMREEGGMATFPAYSQRWSDDQHRGSSSIRGEGWKLIWRAAGWSQDHGGLWADELRELYDLRSDPGEEHNRVTTDTQVLKKLKTKLEMHSQPADPADDVNLTPEEMQHLRSLGYLK